MSEEKNVPNIRFKEFTDPWEQRKLGSTYEITMGQSPNSNNYTKNPNDFILVQGNADIKNGRVVPRMWTKQITKLANPGDIILSVRAPVGDVGITNYTVVLGRGVASISGDDFIYQTLVKMKTFGFWRKFSTGSTFESINSKDIKNAVILVPIANERRNIGTIFKSVDATIALHQQKVTQLKELKKLLMQKIFDQEWRFKGFTDPWEQRKFGECLNVNSGKDYKSLKRGNIPVYGTGGYMCSVDQALSYNEDAIGIGRKGTINKPYILKAPFWTVDTLFYIVPKAKLNLFFVYLIFQKVNWKRKDESTGVPSLSKSIIKSVKELFPKGREQNEIAELFEILDTTIALHQQKVDQLKELKKYLMQNLFV